MYRPVCFIYFAVYVLALSSCGSSKKSTGGGEIVIHSSGTEQAVPDSAFNNRSYIIIQEKYARYLKVAPDQITNIRLYQAIDYWMHTPYKWAGMDENGIDCSAFVQRLLTDVFRLEVPRTSITQFFDNYIDRFASAKYLSEGDLVFFRTDNSKFISHVGMYLKNGMFVNSSSSKGVSLASLEDQYWKTRFVAAGRVKQELKRNVRK